MTGIKDDVGGTAGLLMVGGICCSDVCVLCFGDTFIPAYQTGQLCDGHFVMCTVKWITRELYFFLVRCVCLTPKCYSKMHTDSVLCRQIA
jgi:hypothetical protein